MRETKKSQVEKMRRFVEENGIKQIDNIKYDRGDKSFTLTFNGLPLSYSNFQYAWDLLEVAKKEKLNN